MTTTPAMEADLVAHIVGRGVAGFKATNVRAHGEPHVGGAVGQHVTVVRFFAEATDDYDVTGAVRAPMFQVKHRFDPAADKDGAAALERCRALRDALVLARGFTGASGTVWLDVEVPSPGPRLLEDQYVVWDVTMWRDDP